MLALLDLWRMRPELFMRLGYSLWISSDTTRFDVRALRTTVLAQQTEIRDLWAAYHKRQAQLIEALNLLRTLQTQMAAL
ncbi:hypothetical protein Tco_0494596 [Tanacetum coccineum]